METGRREITLHLDNIVGRTSTLSGARIINVTLLGGSSRVFNKALEASSVSREALLIMITLVLPSYGLSAHSFWILLICPIPIRVWLELLLSVFASSRTRMSACSPCAILLHDAHVPQGGSG